MTPDQPHIMWSGTKSHIGLLAATLIAEGKLDENAKVAAIIPELKDTGFSDATVRQVADQTTNLAYTENEPGMAIGSPEDVDFTNYTLACHVRPRPRRLSRPGEYCRFPEDD
jgi:CubicO group peptidase (beta-lactamase class C family)